MVNMFVNLIRHSDRTGWTIKRVPELWREDVRKKCIEEGLIEPDPSPEEENEKP
ncbi:hypothetical protein [Facklamia miroungae]|uniref:Uncharacterized protein n=1 Tax=Facklamia miroungae TaxID=120956 RepID=A0A1G7P0Y4_9LACT|nr:hypothetical protein [Facklamia miroungae]NKZ28544.1 hypothetical protein [Facklamia miroungae]SDF79978.1 hypothetical protein SAMN05421791_10185 [Facklamia miroungae]